MTAQRRLKKLTWTASQTNRLTDRWFDRWRQTQPLKELMRVRWSFLTDGNKEKMP